MKKQKNTKLTLQKMSITRLGNISSIQGGGTTVEDLEILTKSIGDGSTGIIGDADPKGESIFF